MIDEWADYKELFKLKAALAKLPEGEKAELSCLNEDEAKWYATMLTPEEKKKISKYTWDKIT